MIRQSTRPIARWSERTISGQYALVVKRILVVVGFLIVVAIDVMSNLGGMQLALHGHALRMLGVGGLLVLPAIGALAAGIALLFEAPRFRDWVTERWRGFREIRVLDYIWLFTSIGVLVLYVAVLIGGSVLSFEEGLYTYRAVEELLPVQNFIVYFSMASSVFVVLVFGELARVLYVLSLGPLSLIYLHAVEGTWETVPIGTVLYFTGFNMLALAVLTWFINRSASIDRYAEELQVTTRLAIAERAEHAARHRADSYIHDHLLSVLGPASSDGTTRELLRQEAASALEALDSAELESDRVTVNNLFAKMAGSIRGKDPSVEVDIRVSRSAGGAHVPGEVQSALINASMEALVNSLKHAIPAPDTPIRRRVKLSATRNGVCVQIIDDGVPLVGSVDPTFREGIRLSIIQRMTDVGGHAEVMLPRARGRWQHTGTTVTLSWDTNGSQRGPSNIQHYDTDLLNTAAQARGSRCIAAYLVGIHVIILCSVTDDYSNLYLPIMALAGFAVCVALLVHRWPDARMPQWIKWLSLSAIGIGNLMVLYSIPGHGYPGSAAWTLGAGFMLCAGLFLRVDPVFSWTGMAILCMTTLLWTTSTHRPLVIALTMMVGQVVPLMFWSAVIQWSKSMANALLVVDGAQKDLDAWRRGKEAARKVMDERLRSVGDRTRPFLNLVASESPISAQDRLDARILEAELRDEIRAPSLVETNIGADVSDARMRGIEVVLLDDRTGRSLSTAEITMMEKAASDVLRSTTKGRVVIRLLPEGRSLFATILGPTEMRELRAPHASDREALSVSGR